MPLDRVAPPVQTITTEPTIRVRIAAQQPSIRLEASTLTVGPGPLDAGRSTPRSFRGPVTITRVPGAWLVAEASGATLRWPLTTLAVEANQPIGFNGGAYPGRLALLPSKAGANLLDVVNLVGIETYLPGVLERELFPKWDPAAYRAQAIAARSYALVQMSRKRDEPWDLESTTASQVYGGRASNPRAVDAVQRTRGQTLTYQGRIVEAFFSSNSGGYSQDAVYAFVDRSGWFDIPPLRGRTHGWGTQATYYQWGPIVRDAGEVSRRIAAWGRANDHPVAALVGLRSVQVASRSASSRPAQFTVTDGRGRGFVLACEQFRFACNADAPGLQPVLAKDQLRSSNVSVSVSGSRVTFTNGRGYGHGVGLDQWAAQDMASRGHNESAILATFYPQSQVRRLY